MAYGLLEANCYALSRLRQSVMPTPGLMFLRSIAIAIARNPVAIRPASRRPERIASG